MHLLIIGHTNHYHKDGEILGWGPTVKEINILARYFEEITHLACINDGPIPKSALPYEGKNIKTVLLPSAGGISIKEKVRLLTLGPKYISTINHELSRADVAQIRAPGGLALYAVLLAPFIKKPLWIKFGGNWDEKGFSPPLRSFIRWWLKTGVVRKPITVNGKWSGQPEHVFSFFNPSFTSQEIINIRKKVAKKNLSSPVRFLYAGRLEFDKGVDKVIEIFNEVRTSINAHLEILGDGPLYGWLTQKCAELSILDDVTFHGWQSHERVKELLEFAHFILLPSKSEGWPKILSEGMAYGVVPIASAVSSIPQVLQATGAGLTIPLNDISQYKTEILNIIEQENKWKEMSTSGINAANYFTYEYYIYSLEKMFKVAYGYSPFENGKLNLIRNQF